MPHITWVVTFVVKATRRTNPTTKTTDATDSALNANCGAPATNASVWFAYTASADGSLKTDDMEVQVDPRAEWRQMYREAWRLQRDFLYDPNYHGLNIAVANMYIGLIYGFGGGLGMLGGGFLCDRVVRHRISGRMDRLRFRKS